MKLLVLTVVYTLCLGGNAWAYLDPGTGSIILQGLIATVASTLFVFKSYLYRLKNLFRRGPTRESASDADE